MAGAGVGDEVQISWRGGLGGAQRPPSSTPDPKVSSSCLLASLFGFVSAKRTKGKAKFKSKKEKGEQLRKRKKERNKERKTKDQRTKGLADQCGPADCRGPADQRTSGPGDQRTRGPEDQRTGHLHDWEFQGISSHNEYFLLIQ